MMLGKETNTSITLFFFDNSINEVFNFKQKKEVWMKSWKVVHFYETGIIIAFSEYFHPED